MSVHFECICMGVSGWWSFEDEWAHCNYTNAFNFYFTTASATNRGTKSALCAGVEELCQPPTAAAAATAEDYITAQLKGIYGMLRGNCGVSEKL